MSRFKQAAELLLNADDILILTHRRPDGDTTGSAGALCRALRQAGKEAYIYKNPEITPRYAPLIVPMAPPEAFEPRFVVTTDIADLTLFPDNAAQFTKKVDLVIDHHRSSSEYGKVSLVLPEFAACGEIVWEVICEMGIPLTKDIAQALYIAVSTDTGCFRYSNTTAHSHLAAAACLDTGIDGGELNRALFETKSRARFEIERFVFENMEFFDENRIALVTITADAREKTGATMDDLDSIAALPRQIEGVEIGVTLTENRDGTVKASVRTTKEVDASKICALEGGGGHLRAAGATICGTREEARERMFKAARAVYYGA